MSIRSKRGNSKKRIPLSAQVSTASRYIRGCFRRASSLSQLGAFHGRWLKLRPTDPGSCATAGMISIRFRLLLFPSMDIEADGATLDYQGLVRVTETTAHHSRFGNATFRYRTRTS